MTYKDLVKDGPTFQQKVMGQKSQQKKIVSAAVSVDNSFDHQKLEMIESKKVISRAIVSRPLTHRQPVEQGKKKGTKKQEDNIQMTESEVNQNDSSAFCICGGNIVSDFYVFCEAGEELCPYNGWLHPECTSDLRTLTQD